MRAAQQSIQNVWQLQFFAADGQGGSPSRQLQHSFRPLSMRFDRLAGGTSPRRSGPVAPGSSVRGKGGDPQRFDRAWPRPQAAGTGDIAEAKDRRISLRPKNQHLFVSAENLKSYEKLKNFGSYY